VGCAAAAAHSLGLTPEERAVVNVHWVCSRSVVYVTSVLKPMGRIMIRRDEDNDDDDGGSLGRKMTKQNEIDNNNCPGAHPSDRVQDLLLTRPDA
jgi:hypothetical protein